MGVFNVKVVVFNLRDASKSMEIELVVDTGATYPVIPLGLAEELGIRAVETRTSSSPTVPESSGNLAGRG